MKIIYRAFIKGTNWALAGIMGLFGFTCCDEPADEYGTPHATYKISGRVMNKSGEAIPGIQIELEETLYSGYAAITCSDSKGEYEIERETVGRTDKMRLIASDIDEEENGLYRNDTIQVLIEDKDYYDKGKGWNVGKANKRVDIVLENKPIADE